MSNSGIGNPTNFDKAYINTSPIWNTPTVDYYLEKYLKLLNGNNVLDLGIGEGDSSIYLSRLGYNVMGVDISEKALNICKQYTSNITLYLNDIRNFQIVKNIYNLIISKNDVKSIIKNIKSNLCISGLVYISVFSTKDPSFSRNLNNADFNLLENNVFHNKHDDTYKSYFTKDDILQLFKDLKTISISDEFSLDLSHGKPHYHGMIKYVGQKI